MRGCQSDPTHTYAPVCPCLRARYARVNAGYARGCTRVREYHALSLLSSGWFCTVLVRLDYRAYSAFCGRMATWVALGHFAGLLGLFPGLGGPLRRAGNAGAGSRYLFSLYETTVLGVHTACLGAGPSVWLSVWHSLAEPALSVRPSTGQAGFLSIYRIMKPRSIACLSGMVALCRS